jgi:1,4-alpha-glucan branching enzyme
MGSELAEGSEWSENRELDWNLQGRSLNRGILDLVRNLNRFYRNNPEMHEIETSPESFRWIDFNDSAQSVISFERFNKDRRNGIIFVFNLTPLVRYNYAIGVDEDGDYTEILNTDSGEYGGSGVSNEGVIKSSHTPMHGRESSIELVLPPLSMIAIRRRSE